jgi:hypothetical protein
MSFFFSGKKALQGEFLRRTLTPLLEKRGRGVFGRDEARNMWRISETVH